MKYIYITFSILQMILFFIVYLFIYSSFVAVEYSIKNYDLSSFYYYPILIPVIAIPILFYRFRVMFLKENLMLAIKLTFATSFIAIIGLYFYLDIFIVE